ncbi:MAG: phosphoribosyltransferase [Thermodesulfovibrionia bacterium]|nr:phosphoribosyltransferase [Thermodesulfovibrionia bacterium]
MKGNLVTEDSYRDRVHVFKDRNDAGRKLGEKLIHYRNTAAMVLAIPSGGVPVALEVSKFLSLPMDLILTRKVQIPWNTEAGFGAINPDGEVVFNEELLARLRLTEGEIAVQVQKTLAILQKRNTVFRADRPFPETKNRILIMVDDGLASGYTMRAALSFIRKRDPQKIVVAVPTGSFSTVERIVSNVDELVCLNLRYGFPFAVADAYRHWYDVTDEEVLSLLSAE